MYINSLHPDTADESVHVIIVSKRRAVLFPQVDLQCGCVIEEAAERQDRLIIGRAESGRILQNQYTKIICQFELTVVRVPSGITYPILAPGVCNFKEHGSHINTFIQLCLC